VNEKKTAEEKIFLQHRIDRQAEKIASIGNWEWAVSSGELTLGDNLYRLLELDPDGHTPDMEKIIATLHPDDRDYISTEIKKVMSSCDEGPLQIYDFRIIKKDGGIRFLRSASECLVQEGEKYVVGTVRDITDDVLSQRAITERATFIEALIDSSVDRIMALDKDMKILACNKACEKITTKERTELFGRDLLSVLPDTGSNKIENFKKAFSGEMIYLPAVDEGENGRFEDYYIPLQDDNDNVYGVLNIMHDITEIARYQDDLQKLNESLQQKNFALKMMNEELSTFAFVASHDLREPLRKIQLFSETLMQKELQNLSPNGKDFFKRIISAVQRMNTLIEDILTFSRAGSDSSEIKETDLDKVLSMVTSDLSEMIKQTGAQIENKGLPKFRCNSLQFGQLLQNLLLNAMKFQKKGNVPHIIVSHEFVSGKIIDHPMSSRNKTYLKLQVTDNGIGFDKKYESKIFQMFQRLHGMAEYPGTGMGLAICKKIVENHNGFIIADSTPDNGATFSCYFAVEKNK
jgi:PAS domain S-box-containing protein